MRVITCFAVFLMFAVVGHAQEYYMRHFGVEDGLPSSEAYDVMQDRNGFIWISTDRGLSRYDSYSFRNFTTSDGLTDNTVFSAQEDSAGNIWCATLNGGLCYYTGDTILPYRYNSLLIDSSGKVSVIQSWGVNSRGDVYVGRHQGGCIRIDADGKVTTPRNVSHGDTLLYEVWGDRGCFVFGSRDARDHYKIFSTISVVNFTLNGRNMTIPVGQKFFNYFVLALERNDGTIMVALENQLLVVSPDGTHSLYSFPSRIIKIVDAGGSTWISMLGNGVRRYSYGADYGGSDYDLLLPNESVTDIIQDRESAYWFSTLDHGVYYMTSPKVRWFPLATDMSSSSVTALSQATNGDFLLGTATGQIYRAGLAGAHAIVNTGLGSEYIVNDLHPSADGSGTWVATSRSILFLEDDSIAHPIMASGYGKRICTDETGEGVWMGAQNSLGHFSVAAQRRDSFILINSWVQDLYWDSTVGKLLFGDLKGLMWLNEGRRELYPLVPTPLTTRVNAVTRSGNKLIAGTAGSGVCIIEDGKVTTIAAAQGLCSPLVNDVDVDRNGNIWAATNSGFAHIRFTGDTFTVNCYTIFHGLPTNEVNRVMCSDSIVWIGTSIGAAWFPIDGLVNLVVAPPIYMENVIVNGVTYRTDTSWEFSHDDNHVRFSFLGISFRNAGSTMYRYRLIGLDSAWTTTSNRSVDFASLSPGEYRFEVLARNGDGTWSTMPAVFSFTINPPVWMRWWFWLLGGIILVGLAWFFVSRRLRNVRYMSQQKTVLAEYQHQALAAQMNPHFIFNSLTSMQAFILGDEKENALKYVDRFSFLMRKSMEHSMMKFVPLDKEIELLRAYFDLESMRFGDRLTCAITCDEKLDTVNVEVPAMMVQPFAENAIRHGVVHREEAGGRVDVSFEWKDDALWCRVEDNGVGRKRSAEINRSRLKHISFGSSITEERLRVLCEVMDQEHKIIYTDKFTETGIPAGTLIYFKLPSRKRERHA